MSKDADEIQYKREAPLIWRPVDSLNLTATSCRNSIQGRELIVDEEGYICSRIDLTETGCCRIESGKHRQYDCKKCDESHCCSVYEHCVSCCLHPDKVSGAGVGFDGEHF